MALGAPEGAIACHTSGSLLHPAAAKAPGADPNPFGGAVDQGAYGLQVGLEPARSDVVGVRDRPAECGALPADFTPLRHDCLQKNPGSNNDTGCLFARNEEIKPGLIVQGHGRISALVGASVVDCGVALS